MTTICSLLNPERREKMTGQVGNPLHDHDLGDGLDEILPKAIGVSPLGRDHEHVVHTYVLSEIAVSHTSWGVHKEPRM